MPEDPRLYQINEQESGRYTALLVGDDGVTPLPGSTLTTLQLTLYVTLRNGTDQIINARENQNVLNTNDVQVLETPLTDSAGRQYNLIWSIRPADTIIVDDSLLYERHIGLWVWTFPNGGKGVAEMALNVRNIRRIA